MELSIYDFVTLCIVVPIIFFRFTLIPEWLFAKARKTHPAIIIFLIGIGLTALAGFVATHFTEGFAVRFLALAVAVLACVIHYLYTKEKDSASNEQADKNA
ncbi:MAG: hypothetical protein IJS54_03035 [Desulfovibrio sp.]|nr:hypothetical protein [Desulfovibrio sp.]